MNDTTGTEYARILGTCLARRDLVDRVWFGNYTCKLRDRLKKLLTDHLNRNPSLREHAECLETYHKVRQDLLIQGILPGGTFRISTRFAEDYYGNPLNSGMSLVHTTS